VPVVLDLSHTAHCRSHTGIQHTCRQLLAALQDNGATPVAVIYDRYAHRWRSPDATERALLSPAAADNPGHRRGEVWTLAQKLRGLAHRGAEPDWAALRDAPLIVPEIFTPRVFAALPELRARARGPAITIFYDAVVLRHPELSPPASVARFASYLRELANFDGIAAISEASRAELLEHWQRLEVRNPPPVVAIPLGVSPPREAPEPLTPENARLGAFILSVGTIEGRKNHLALLEAAEILWREGRHFRLVLAGLHRPETASPALQLAASLQAAGRPLDLPGPVPDSVLTGYYYLSRFTVYPSHYEGFGLPVAESLLRLRPCICGTGGALAEVSAGGGCLVVPEPSAAHLAQAMRKLLDDDALYSRLTAEAAQRRFSTWADYSRRLREWLGTLPRRGES
jgi:glycosyltransferase involved in cell wall biosynthesis